MTNHGYLPQPRTSGTGLTPAGLDHQHPNALPHARLSGRTDGTSRQVMPADMARAAALIVVAYADDSGGTPPGGHLANTTAQARVAAAVLAHASAHGTVLRPSARTLRDLAVAVWLPAEAPPLPDLDPDVVAGCGSYLQQLIAHATGLQARYGSERYDVLWFVAVHPTVQRCGIARALLHHRHQVLASQNRRVFALAPTEPARALLTGIGFCDHPATPVLSAAVAGGGTPPSPLRWGQRRTWTDLLNGAGSATRAGRT